MCEGLLYVTMYYIEYTLWHRLIQSELLRSTMDDIRIRRQAYICNVLLVMKTYVQTLIMTRFQLKG